MSDAPDVDADVLDGAEQVYTELHVAIKAASERGVSGEVVLLVLACCVAEFIRAQPDEETRAGVFLTTVSVMKTDIDVSPETLIKAVVEQCPQLLERMPPGGEA